jgi:magnesium transporter
MIEVYFKTLKTKKLKLEKDFRSGSWINLENATSEDLDKIAKLTGLDLIDIQDSLDVNEIPRIEKANRVVLVYVRFPSQYPSGNYTQTMTVILTSKYIITISPFENGLVRKIVSQQINLATTQQSKLLIYLLLQISRDFTIKVKQVNDKVMKQKKELTKVDMENIQFLIQSEDVLNQYLLALVPMEGMFNTMKSSNIIQKYQEDLELLEDLFVGISQSVNICKVNLKGLVSLRDSYQIVFTNNLNKTIKFLTSFTVILTVPTLIGSLFGMNVRLPLENDPLAFVYIILIILLLSLVSLLIFIWKKWF